MGTAHPGVGRHILPGGKLGRQPGKRPCIARLGRDIDSLLRVRLAIKQFILWPGYCQIKQLIWTTFLPKVIFLERNSPGKRLPGPCSVDYVLKCRGKVSVLVNGEWRPVVEVVDQSVPGNENTDGR